MKSKKGFTLIEMLVVIILIGIILVIVLPSVTKLSNNSSKKMYETYLDVVVESAVDLYTDQYKGELADENAECFNINYQTLLKDGLVDETDVFCDGNIIIRENNSTNSLENSYYLTCRDSKGNEVNKSEKVPSGCRGFNGKFNMEYAIYTDSAKTKPYDGTYYVKDAYVVFTSTSPYSFAIDHYEYSIKLDGNWKTITSGSHLGSIADIKNLNGTLNVRAVDQDNNESSSVRIPVKLDNTGPTFTTSMTGGWLEKTVTISEATDKQVGTLAELPYSFDGGQNWQNEPTKNYTENQKINICVRDSLNNKTCKDFEISGIDNVPPQAPTLTATDGIGSGKWHTANTTLTASGSSALSGITYYLDKNSNPTTVVQNGSLTITENTASTTYYAKACNGAGLCSDVVSYELKLDKTTPKTPTLAATDGIASGKWHKADTTLTVSGSSSISGITYYLDTNSNPQTVTNSVQITANTGSTTYYAKACNGAGLCSSVGSYELKLDKSTPAQPSLTANDGIGSGKWHKADTTLTAGGSTALSGITYYIDASSNPTTSRSSLQITSNTASTTYYVKACSGSGLCSSVGSYELKLDKTTPAQPSLTANDGIASGKWHKADTTLIVSGSSSISGITYYLDTNSNPQTVTNSVKITANTGSITYYAKVCNGAGLCSSVASYEVKLDKTTPAQPSLTANDGIASGSWHKADTTLTAGGSTAISGITYYLDTSSNPTTSRSSLQITSNTASTTYYVKACSGSGLCSSVGSYELKLDKSTPQCKIVVATGTAGSNGWYKSDITLKLEITGTTSGVLNSYLSQNSITENTTEKVVTGNVTSNAGIVGNCTATFKVDKSTPATPTLKANDGIGSGSWHKADTTLTASGSSSTSGITYYLDTNSNPQTATNSIQITDNTASTKYYVKACNGAGTCSGVVNYDLKLDKTTPATPTLTANDGIRSGSWHKANTALTAGGSTAISGITYYLDTSSNPTTSRSSVQITDNTVSTRYYVKACSGSGICSGVGLYDLKLDKTTPTITTNLSPGTYNTTKTVTFTVVDTVSGVRSMGFEVQLNGVTKNKNLSYRGNSLTIDLNNNGTWVIIINFSDYANNSDSKSYSYIIKTEYPAVEFTYDATKSPKSYCAEPGGLCRSDWTCVLWGQVCKDGSAPDFNEGYDKTCRCGNWVTDNTQFNYTCPDGGTLRGEQCVKLTCPYGGTLVGEICKQ